MSTGGKSALLKGAAWFMASRWVVKALGFVNTMIMARLLLPSDYGVVGMAMLVVGLTEALLNLGTSSVLISKPEIDRADIDSAWTLRLLQILAVSLVIALAAWPASQYFREARVLDALLVFAACIAVSGAGNIGPVLSERELDFSVGFKIAVLGKVIGVLATWCGAWLFKDYRALVAGVAAGYLSGFVLSYLLHDYRPRIEFTRMAMLWQTSKWLMLSSVANFTLRKGDEIAAGRLGTAAEYGLYSTGSDLGQMPTGEVGPAILRAFMPVLSSIQDDKERMRAAVLKTVGAVNAVTMPICAMVVVLAPAITDLLLGANWGGAAIYVAVFSIVSALLLIGSPLNTMLFVLGHARAQSAIVWAEFGCFVLAALALCPRWGLLGLAGARVVGAGVNAMLVLGMASRLGGLPARKVCWVLLRPLCGAALAAFAAWATLPMAATWLPVGKILWASLIGGTFYLVWTFSTWHFLGRFQGAESTLVDICTRLSRRPAN